MTTYYHVVSGSRFISATRVQLGGTPADDESITDFSDDDLIIAVHFQDASTSGKNPSSQAWSLQWANTNAPDTWYSLGNTGELTYNATTNLVDDTALTATNWACSVDAGLTDDETCVEREGSNADISMDLAPDSETEFQIAVDFSGSDRTNGDTYKFRIVDSSESQIVNLVPTVTVTSPSAEETATLAEAVLGVQAPSVTATYQAQLSASLAEAVLVVQTNAITAQATNEQTATLSEVVLSVAGLSVTATYEAQLKAELTETALTVQDVSVTATYEAQLTASLGEATLLVQDVPVTATYQADLSATLAVAQLTVQAPAVIATASNEQTATLGEAVLTVQAPSVTSTYIQEETATLDVGQLGVEAPTVTAEFAAGGTASLSVAQLGVEAPSVTPTHAQEETATLAEAVLGVEAPSVTTTYTQEETAGVVVAQLTVEAPSVTAEFTAGGTASLTVVQLSVEAPSVSPTYIQIETANLVVAQLASQAPTVTPTYVQQETAGVGEAVLGVNTPSVTPQYEAQLSASLSEAILALVTPSVSPQHLAELTASLAVAEITVEAVAVTATASTIGPTIETIGSSGCDYLTPQTWYDAHKGDITSDPNAPYIGVMEPETFVTGLGMNQSTTDATHYFHLRAKSGSEFDGNFAAGSHPVIDSYGSNWVSDDYTILEGFVFDGGTLPSWLGVPYLWITGSNVSFDTVGFYDAGHEKGAYFGETLQCVKIEGGQDVVIRNCAIGNYIDHNTTTGFGRAEAIGIHILNGASARIYNCSIQGVTAIADGTGDEIAYGIKAESSTTVIINNIVGSLVADETTKGIEILTPISSDLQYNATTDTTGGTNSQDNITPANEFADITPATMDLHMLVGGQCENNGLNLIEQSYQDAPTEDCDGEIRPTTGTWSIGIDYVFTAVVSTYHELVGIDNRSIVLHGATTLRSPLIGADSRNLVLVGG